MVEKEKQKVSVEYDCPKNQPGRFSGMWRRGDDVECLLVFDEKEHCYYLEKLHTVYEGLKLKTGTAAQNASSQHAPISTMTVPPELQPNPVPAPPPTLIPPVIKTAEEASQPAPKRRRTRRTADPGDASGAAAQEQAP